MKTKLNSTGSPLATAASRPYWRVEDAEAVLSVWHESGVSVSAFARRHGINVARLLRWRRRLVQEGGLEFHPVKLVPESNNGVPATGAVELVLLNGHRVAVHRGFDGVLLEELVRAVESWSC